MSPRRVALVPHTHWDREWYESFQSFRYKLVQMLDQLIDLLESDPSYTEFMLDGQMAVVDDYLEVRPENEERIRALATSGRLTMGPWYILLDEFLVSGETIVRDLEMGIARGASFGGVMQIGYLPDMFGHVAQMPQILRQFGIEDAVVWRGVPSDISATAFTWEAPDGSSVRAEYLPTGYGNGAALPGDAKALVRRVSDHEQELSPFLLDEMLIMNGSDHLRAQPGLGRTVAEANELQDDYRLAITSLPDYLSRGRRQGLAHWQGELRSGARANVLMGVTSNRVDVKRAAARAELAVERRAEPYAALLLGPESWPERLLGLAWREMVRNAAHDSICACSVDDVVDAVNHRYAEARTIGEEVATDALKALARSMAERGPVVANASSHARRGVVELVVSGEGLPEPGTQVLSERTGLPGFMTLDADTVRTVLGMLQGPKIDNDTFVQDVKVTSDDSGLDVTVFLGSEERPDVAISEAKQEIYTRLGAQPDAVVRIRLDQPPIRRIVARTAEVPGFGWRALAVEAPTHPVEVDETAAVELSNGLVRVVLDPEEATFAVDGTAGFGRLVEGGDVGDSYNYSPPRNDRLVDRPTRVSLAVSERGPVRASASITADYLWPEYGESTTGNRVGEKPVTVVTTIELRADDPVVRVRTSFTNPARDHRVRVHLPLPTPAAHSVAESAFGTVERGLEIEGRPDELGLPTFPSRRFVRAGGLTVTHHGVTEYELIDLEETAGGERAGTLALTVLRSTGMLSRLGMAYRPFPAGPLTPVEGLQLLGSVIEFEYAVTTSPIDPWLMADDFLLPLEAVHALGGGDRPSVGCELSVRGAEVSSVRRRQGLVEVRVFNPSDRPTTVDLGSAVGWLVDLGGRPVSPFEGRFELRAMGIATARLTGR